MKVAIIIVGIGQWEEYTKSLVESIRRFEGNKASIHMIDNGNEIDYGTLLFAHNSGLIDSCSKIIRDLDNNPVSYAEAINVALDEIEKFGVPDWYIILNNDVVCLAPFYYMFEGMSENNIYGNTIHTSHNLFESKPFIDGWLYAIPRKALEDIGTWDEKFLIAGFEDADYSLRAWDKGYMVLKSYLPFEHLEYHIRKTFDGYSEQRLANAKYLVEKHNLKWKT